MRPWVSFKAFTGDPSPRGPNRVPRQSRIIINGRVSLGRGGKEAREVIFSCGRFLNVGAKWVPGCCSGVKGVAAWAFA